jgi:hypothetical protein
MRVNEPINLYYAIRDTITSTTDGDRENIILRCVIYVLSVGSDSVFWQMRMSVWPSVNGRLGKFGLRKFSRSEWALSNQQYLDDALYVYQVDGINTQLSVAHLGSFLRRIIYVAYCVFRRKQSMPAPTIK